MSPSLARTLKNSTSVPASTPAARHEEENWEIKPLKLGNLTHFKVFKELDSMLIKAFRDLHQNDPVSVTLTYRSALMISWYSVYLCLRTTISTGSTAGGTLIRPSLDLATGSVRDFLPRTASTSTALLGARSRAACTLLPPTTWNMLVTRARR